VSNKSTKDCIGHIFITETDAAVTKHSAATLCTSHISSVSLFYNQFVSHRWQHIFTFVSAVDVSDSCTNRIKEYWNHTETAKCINWNLMCQLCCIEKICCRQEIVSEIMSLWSASFLVSTYLWNHTYDKMCASFFGFLLVKFWRRSQGASHMYIEDAADWWTNEIDCPACVTSHAE